MRITGCQSKTRTIECSDQPERFRVEKFWAGRKEITEECLAHAVASEKRGQKVDLILT